MKKGPEIVFAKHMVRRGDGKIIFRGHLNNKKGDEKIGSGTTVPYVLT
jgi:hypothetical protein